MPTEIFDCYRKGKIAVWIGNFNNSDEFYDYLQEKIEDNYDENQPINRFSEEYNLGFYDSDFQEAEIFSAEISIEELLKPFSYSDTFIKEVSDIAQKSHIYSANTVILLYDFEYKRENLPLDSPIKFVGNFDYFK